MANGRTYRTYIQAYRLELNGRDRLEYRPGKLLA